MQSLYIFSNMCSSPVCIRFENPFFRRQHVLEAKQHGINSYKQIRLYRLGLPTNNFKNIEDDGLPIAKHLVPSTKIVGTDTFVFHEPLPDTCDPENYPFPSHLYYHIQDFPHIEECMKPLFRLGRFGFKDGEVCMYVPCGHCAECVQKFKNSVEDIVTQDIMACKDIQSFFITLTYDPENLVRDTDQSKLSVAGLPDGFAHCPTGFLSRKDLQDYLKRLRITLKRWYDIDDVRIVYCGEYGKNTIRPHYHILIWFERTDKSRLGYPFLATLRGKNTLFKKYIVRKKRVPSLTKSVFMSISYNLWKKCSVYCHRVEIPRNNLAISRYICKYLFKTKCPEKVSFLNGKFAPSAIPCFFRISNNIGKNVISRYVNDEQFLKRGTIFRTDKSGNLVELPLNERLMRKVSRHLFKLGVCDYLIEREQYLHKYILGKLDTTFGAILKKYPWYSLHDFLDPCTGIVRLNEFKDKIGIKPKDFTYINQTINTLTSSKYE